MVVLMGWSGRIHPSLGKRSVRTGVLDVSYSKWCAVLVTAVAALVGCSGAERADSDAPESTVRPEPTLAKECSDEGSALGAACQNSAYLSAARGPDGSLDDLTDDEVVSFARNVCAYADVLRSMPAEDQPLYGDFLASTAASWGKPVEVVNAVVRSAAQLCPESAPAIEGIPRSRTSLPVVLSVEGAGEAAVSFTLPDGSTTTETVTTPWTQTLQLTRTIPVTLSVASSAGNELSCRITVEGNVVADSGEKVAPSVTCDAGVATIDLATVPT